MSGIRLAAPRGLLVVAAWVLAVVAGSGLAWYAVDRAGQAVLQGGSAPPASASPTPTTSSGTPVPPTSGTTSTPEGSPGTTTPSGASSPADAVTGARQTDGGTLSVSCAGQEARLVYATPASGWSVEVRDRGPDRVRVRFERRVDGDEGEVDVRASCPAGRPVFTVERS